MSRTSTRGCIRRNTAGDRNSSNTPSRSPGILPLRSKTAGKSCSSRSGTDARWGDPDVGQLRVFAVEKDCRRQGIGAALLQAALEKAESAGYRRLMLWTADAVTDALRKYEALGFRVTETKENRTWRPDGEAVVEIKMEKELG